MRKKACVSKVQICMISGGGYVRSGPRVLEFKKLDVEIVEMTANQKLQYPIFAPDSGGVRSKKLRVSRGERLVDFERLDEISCEDH